ncbi:MAG: DUF1232 domain-containing protein [Planctomycetota bacterium]
MACFGKIGPIGRALMFWKVLRDRSVPWWGKLSFIAASLGYIAFPIDAVPDLFFGVGWIDDLIALPVFAWLFGRVLPRITRWNAQRRRRSVA